MKTWLAFWSGIFKNNPTFRLVLGLCPTLAVTTSLENALGMGLAASFVLICSNGIISALRKLIPDAVHIPCYIVIVATFVTATDLLMQAYLPALSESLGIFIPLIVVNCVILGRAEAFACKNGVVDSLADNTERAAKDLGYDTIVLAGGVSANSFLRKRFEEICEKNHWTLYMPELQYCGDNGAMVAAQGYYEYIAGHRAGLDLNAKATMAIDAEF